MPLESFSSDGIQLSELALNRPELRYMPFDPERDMEVKDWDKVREKAIARRSDGEWVMLFDLQQYANCLSPHRFPTSPLDEVGFKCARQQLKEARLKNNWSEFLRIGSILKNVFPEQEGRLYLDPVSLHGISMFFKKLEDKLWTDYCDKIIEAKILFPEQQKQWVAPREVLARCLERIGRCRASADWRSLIGNAAQYRLLAPEQWNHEMVTRDDWAAMQQCLKKERKSKHFDAASFARLAADMRICAVDQASITERGITLVPRSVRVAPVGPVPSVRKFIASLPD